MQTHALQTLTDATFADTVRSTPKLVVKFSAPWCPPCKPMHTTLEAIARDAAGPGRDAAFYDVDVDAHPECSGALGVRALPTTILFVDGRPVAQLVGNHDRKRVEKWLAEHATSRAATPTHTR